MPLSRVAEPTRLTPLVRRVELRAVRELHSSLRNYVNSSPRMAGRNDPTNSVLWVRRGRHWIPACDTTCGGEPSGVSSFPAAPVA
jgi:hypothetical protein